MAVKISEDTNVQLDLKTIGIIIGFVISLATVFFTLKADIALAKELPKPPITRSEYDLKDQLVREQIMNTGREGVRRYFVRELVALLRIRGHGDDEPAEH